MRQFDVVANETARTRTDPPLLVNLQADAIESTTVIVAPLWPANASNTREVLQLDVTLDGRFYRLSVAELTSARRSQFGEPIANLEKPRYQLIRMLDLLFTGV